MKCRERVGSHNERIAEDCRPVPIGIEHCKMCSPNLAPLCHLSPRQDIALSVNNRCLPSSERHPSSLRPGQYDYALLTTTGGSEIMGTSTASTIKAAIGTGGRGTPPAAAAAGSRRCDRRYGLRPNLLAISYGSARQESNS